jgi:hypothetical protein
MGRRAGLSTVLIMGSLVLLIAILVGMNMGNRVLGQIGVHVPVEPTPVAPATAPAEGGGAAAEVGGWKRTSVMSVATDPGFPDPRVTPEPELPSTPRPRPTPTKTRPPLPTAPPRYNPAAAPTAASSGSPAVGPETSPGPDIEATPNGAPRPTGGRTAAPNYPTMPPVPVPSLNP